MLNESPHPVTTKWLKSLHNKPKPKKAKKRDLRQALQKFKQRLRKDATPAELRFKQVLIGYGIRFRFQSFFTDNNKTGYIVDFLIDTEKHNIVIEIDGAHHFTNEGKLKDRERSKWLKSKRGCKIIRFTNSEVIDNPTECIKRLAHFFLTYNRNDSVNFRSFSEIAKL